MITAKIIELNSLLKGGCWFWVFLWMFKCKTVFPISSLGLVGMNLVCCMSETGIEAPLRTRFLVGVMVLLEAPAIACGE